MDFICRPGPDLSISNQTALESKLKTKMGIISLTTTPKPKFALEFDRRFSHTLISIMEDGVAIGWISIHRNDEDLIPHVKDLIEKFNVKYTEEPPQTKTTGDPIHREPVSVGDSTGQDQ